MHKIKAIQTIFRGIKFRSRLEARWACFFYTAGIHFHYEPEGYDLGNGKYYLPDFYLQDQDCYVEVKGKRPTREEEDLAFLLAKQSGKTVHIFAGPVPEPEVDLWSDSAFDLYTFGLGPVTIGHKYANRVYCLNRCPICGKIDFCVRGDVSTLPCHCSKVSITKMDKAIYRAYCAARMARFE